MAGQTIGYIRVSTHDQNPDRQLDQHTLDKVFTENASGKDSNRPKLQEMIEYVREGDNVLVHSMDRLARNLDDLRSLVKMITDKGVAITFTKEGLTFKGDDSPTGKLILSIMGAFAEFERSLIKERQMEGVALAKKRGVYHGRKKSLTTRQVEELKEKVKNGGRKSLIAKEFGVSRATLYKYLDETIN